MKASSNKRDLLTSLKAMSAVEVGLDFGSDIIDVGTLMIHEGRIYFEYDAAFLDQGLSISPIHLPFQLGLQRFERDVGDGLAGVFDDSLPDGWGRLMVDRHIKGLGITPTHLHPIHRLALVGSLGMGALVYRPTAADSLGALIPNNEHASMAPTSSQARSLVWDELAHQAQQVLADFAGEPAEVFARFQAINGSSGGARPKVVCWISEDMEWVSLGPDPQKKAFEASSHPPVSLKPWLVKFPNQSDGAYSGAVEFVYAQLAALAGIEMMPVHLFESEQSGTGLGYFGTWRFDRSELVSFEDRPKRWHLHSAAGLLHADFRVPALDYVDLIKLTARLTRNQADVWSMYRLAVFNVLAHNRDDHGKNFSFLMDEMGQWRLSPAYDLTFSQGIRGEQSTLVAGVGRDPGVDDLKRLAREVGMEARQVQREIDAVQTALSQWQSLAQGLGLSQGVIHEVASGMQV